MSKVATFTKAQADYLLYFTIAFLTAWQVSNFKYNTASLLGSLLAGLIALKAKRSDGDKDKQ